MNRSEENNENHSMEEVFLSRIRHFVLENLTCEDFSIERLSHEIGYSRSQIHRKLKKITGKSLTQFIREIRLEEALKLLEGRIGNVSEVSYMVGFSSPVYFNKCFYEYYGVRPGEILKMSNPLITQGKDSAGRINYRKPIIYTSVIILCIAITYLVYIVTKPTVQITLKDDSGKKEKVEVYRESYIHKVLITTFKPENNSDSNYFWFKFAIPDGIRDDLSQFNYMEPFLTSKENKQERIDLSARTKSRYYITGTYRAEDKIIYIKPEIVKGDNGITVASGMFIGDNLFSLLDSVSVFIRYNIGINHKLLSKYPDLQVSELTTHNLEAYEYYIYEKFSGIFKKERKHFGNALKALELDSTFAQAAYVYADFAYCFAFQTNPVAEKFIKQACRHNNKMPWIWKVKANGLAYLISGDSEKRIELYELQSQNKLTWKILVELRDVYFQSLRYRDCLKLSKKLYRIDRGNSETHRKILSSYLYINEPSKGIRFAKKLIRKDPDSPASYIFLGKYYLRQNKLEDARNSFERAILINPNWLPNKMYLAHIDYIINKPGYKKRINTMTGTFISQENGKQLKYFMLNGHLSRQTNTSAARLIYPVSDTSHITDDAFRTVFYSFSAEGDVVKIKDVPYIMYAQTIFWKSDSLISCSIDLLASGQLTESLETFRSAFEKHPDHFYLGNYIKHIEYILDEKEETIPGETGKYEGFYLEPDEFMNRYYYLRNNVLKDSLKTQLYRIEDKYYMRQGNGFEFRLLQMSENTFMFPGRYNTCIEFRNNTQNDGFYLTHHFRRRIFLH